MLRLYSTNAKCGASATASLLIPALLLIQAAVPASSEIGRFDGNIIAASSTSMHYAEGFIVAPGYVDISDLVFYDGPVASLDDTRASNSFGGTASATGGTVIDIVLFLQPPGCSAHTHTDSCDWTALGVGAAAADGSIRWCCADDAEDLGLCGGGEEAGRLIVNATKFSGSRRIVDVPPSRAFTGRASHGRMEVADRRRSGKYVVVIANCNDKAGRDVAVSGTCAWASKWGFLPGELYGELCFFAAVTIVYSALLVLFGCAMRRNGGHTTGVQNLLVVTVVLGLVTYLMHTGDLVVWNRQGTRSSFLMYTAAVLDVLKRTISHCLFLIVSLGWGVIYGNLGRRRTGIIVVLGLLYAGLSIAHDILEIYVDDSNLSFRKEVSLIFDVVTMNRLIFFINLAFFAWILCALIPLPPGLEDADKKRFVAFRQFFLLSMACAAGWGIFGIVNEQFVVLGERTEWLLKVFWELIYLMLLVTVAWLWKPSPSMTAPIFVTELSAVENVNESSGGDVHRVGHKVEAEPKAGVARHY